MHSILIFAGILVACAARENLCLYCDHVAIPQDCTRVLRCGRNEDCSVDKFVTPDGLIYYSLGCRDNIKCSGAASALGKRSLNNTSTRLEPVSSLVLPYLDDQGLDDTGDTSYCRMCCDSDLCNVESLCGSPVPNYYNGTVCFKCDNLEDPGHCHQITLCDESEVCHVEQTVNSFSKRILYRSGCKKRADTTQGPPNDAEYSCKSKLCNDNLPCNIEITEKPVLGVPYEENGVQKFNCTFKSMTNRQDVSYKVSWMVDGKPLYNEKGPIVYIASYEKIGYLDIDTLKGNLNKMLRCKVQAFCDHEKVVGGKAVQSNPYWVGVKVSPLTIAQHQETVRIETTIPMIPTDKTKPLPVVRLQTRPTNDTCDYRFQYDSNTRQYYVDIPLTLQPHSFPVQRDKLLFKPLMDVYFHPWLNFQIPPVHTDSFVTPDKLKQCVVAGDTIKVFDDSKLKMNNTMEAEIVLFKRDSSPFLQVHILREACNRGMCTCAVIVQEGNSGLQIDVCGQTTDFVPIVTYLSKTSQEEISLTPSKDSLQILVTTLSGNNVTVNMAGPDNDMGITLSIKELNIGRPGGLCGNATWLAIPGVGNIGSVDGVAVTENEYVTKWSVPQAAASLVNTTLPYDPNLQTNITKCSCIAKNTIECATTL